METAQGHVCGPALITDNLGSADINDWLLAADGPTPFICNPGGCGAFDVNPGTYTLTESGPGGYTASDWVCTGEGNQVDNQITLAEGESAVCTITNDDVPPVPVPLVSAWTMLLMILMMLAAGWYYRPAQARRF